MNKRIIVILIILFLTIINVDARINLTVISENEMIVKTIPLSNTSNIVSNNTNDIISLEYDNYILNLYPDSTKLTNNNGTFIISNLAGFNNDRYKVIWIVVIFSLIGLAYLVIKNVMK